MAKLLARFAIGVLASTFMVSCATTAISLDYQPGLNQGVPGPKTVVVGRFIDSRGEDEYYLGRVKTPLGTTVENISTRVPIKQVVRNAFSHGLSSRGMLSSNSGASHMLTGEILDFYCDQVVRPAAEIRIRVNLVDTTSGEVVYRRVYESSRSGGSFVPGSGSPVPVLNELASRVLQDVVDEAVDDSGMRHRLRRPSSTPAPSSYDDRGYRQDSYRRRPLPRDEYRSEDIL